MTSRPLFIIVAESMVFFVPMRQVGCASASRKTGAGHFFAAAYAKMDRPRRSRRSRRRSPALRRPGIERSRCARCRPATVARRCAPPPSTSSSPAATMSSLLATAIVDAAFDRGKDGVERDGAVGCGQHDVGRRSRPRRASAPAGRRPPSSPARSRNAATCSASKRGVAPSRQTDDLEAIGMARDHVERLGADRSGRAENGNSVCASLVLAESPSRWSVAKNATPPNRYESKRSSTPP